MSKLKKTSSRRGLAKRSPPKRAAVKVPASKLQRSKLVASKLMKDSRAVPRPASDAEVYRIHRLPYAQRIKKLAAVYEADRKFYREVAKRQVAEMTDSMVYDFD